MLQSWSVFLGASRYEFLMQIRRRSFWVTFVFLVGLYLLLTFSQANIREEAMHYLTQAPLLTALVSLTYNVNLYFPIGVGLLLADRLPRDRRTKVDELLTAMPGPLGARLFGKYMGSMLATLLPIFLFYCISVGIIASTRHDLLALPLGLETFLVIIVPGILFISAFSIACPAIIKIPLYQFLFIGYWLWGAILWWRPELPTLGRTLISPVGVYMIQGIYGFQFGGHGVNLPATPLEGVASILVLIGIGLLVMVVLERCIKWNQAHQ